MKTNSYYRYILAAILFCFASFGYSYAEDPADKPAPTQEVKKVDPKDAVMSFILEKANKYSDKAETAISKAVDVVTEETPKLIKEFLIWRAIYHGSFFFIPLFLFFVFITTYSVACFKVDWNEYSEFFTIPQFIGVVSFVLSLVSGLVALCNIDHLLSLIQIWIAPRIYLIEQAIELLRKH